jgi:hypothetical protein
MCIKKMQIDDSYTNCVSGDTDSISYCECCGQDSACPECEGTGHIYLPFPCMHPTCKEGFETIEELDEHHRTEHGIEPLSFQ